MGLAVGVIYFKLKPHSFSFSTFDCHYFELITIFTVKYELFESQKCPHNPEVVGSSPASATIKTPDFDKKSGVFLTFWLEMKLGQKPFWVNFGSLGQKTGILGHRPALPGGFFMPSS